MKNQKDKNKEEELKPIELDERIDMEKDPIIRLFWQHIRAGLIAFANTNISAEDAYARYKHLISLAHKFLYFGQNQDAEPKDEIDEKVKDIVEVMLKRKRTIKVQISI